MSPLRRRLNAAFMPRATFKAHSPSADLRLPDWYIAAAFVGVFLFGPVAMSAMFLLPLSTPPWIVSALIFVPQLTGLAIYVLASRRLRRFVRASNEAGAILCTACHYRIDGLEDAGLCPECGAIYTVTLANEEWAKLRRVLLVPERSVSAKTPPPARTEPAGQSPGP